MTSTSARPYPPRTLAAHLGASPSDLSLTWHQQEATTSTHTERGPIHGQNSQPFAQVAADSREQLHGLQSRRDLTALGEVSDAGTGAFLCSAFTYLDKHDCMWFGQANVRKLNLTVDDLRHNLERVPDEKIYPVVEPFITIVTNADRPGFFIKRPRGLRLTDEELAKLLPRMLIEEAEILEFLQRNQHPNIVRYYGCTVRRGHITGIVLERHSMILQYRHEDDDRHFDVTACIQGIRAGVAHLHSLGFAHNDLNPANIALDKKDNPVILDFGSCRKFNEQLITAGTPGWIDDNYKTSSPGHDRSAIQKLEVWMMKKNSEREDKSVVGKDGF
ncbi:hypothetical protein DOTSEDRAFT_72553 [Dothistroma septosporum NZE10]|uniref:Protein kinase domain-containing protein n=1 Tax=Dothistroma septosporum (strain NZE10 / CBS 128990) TaxID=675120 RepID=M2Y4I6_DOTSN|nr:hypothetical protein DOTSEDRAFT_72553 [Dothistroma septosporum NZE10]